MAFDLIPHAAQLVHALTKIGDTRFLPQKLGTQLVNQFLARVHISDLRGHMVELLRQLGHLGLDKRERGLDGVLISSKHKLLNQTYPGADFIHSYAK